MKEDTEGADKAGPPATETAARRTRPRPLVRLLIRHAAGPIAWVVIALVVVAFIAHPLLGRIKGNISELEVASFRVRLEKSAERTGVALDQELRGLRALTMDQLHLFLVIGGDTGDEVVYRFEMPRPRARRNYEALVTHGLLELTDTAKEGETPYRTTQRGRLVHKLLMDQLYGALVLGGVT